MKYTRETLLKQLDTREAFDEFVRKFRRKLFEQIPIGALEKEGVTDIRTDGGGSEREGYVCKDTVVINGKLRDVTTIQAVLQGALYHTIEVPDELNEYLEGEARLFASEPQDIHH
jgi:hypothetical protein